MLKIKRSWDRLIFNMGIPILVRQHLYIETPSYSQKKTSWIMPLWATYWLCIVSLWSKLTTLHWDSTVMCTTADSLWLSDAIQHQESCVNIGSDNGLVPSRLTNADIKQQHPKEQTSAKLELKCKPFSLKKIYLIIVFVPSSYLWPKAVSTGQILWHNIYQHIRDKHPTEYKAECQLTPIQFDIFMALLAEMSFLEFVIVWCK